MTKAAAVLAVLALLATAAGGAQISQIQPFSGTPDYTRNLVFDQIDLGPDCTLNWIRVVLTASSDGGQLILDNDSETTATGSFEFGSTTSVGASAVTMLDSANNPVVGVVKAIHSGTFSLAPNEGDGAGDYDPTPPDGMLYVGGYEFAVNSGYINSMFHSQYIGTGTFTVDVNANQWMNYGGVSGIEVAFTPVTAGGSMEIIYDYTCIPEPSSVLALVAGLGTLVGFRRRKA